MIISESQLRKIIKEKILEEKAINEIGFSKIRATPGRIEYKKCNLKMSEGPLRLWIASVAAMFFIYNPRVQADGEEKTRNGWIFLMSNLGDPQIKQFREKIIEKIKNNDRAITFWIEKLEDTITYIFGPRAYIYCNILTTLFEQDTSSQSSSSNDSNNINISDLFENTVIQAGGEYIDAYNLAGKNYNPKDVFFFPNTFVEIENGDKSEAQVKFDEEKMFLNDLITTDSRNVSNIKSEIEKMFEDLKGRARRKIMRVVNEELDKLDDTYDSGDEIRASISAMLSSSITSTEALITSLP